MNTKSFALIELLIVLGIVTIVSSVFLPNLNFLSKKESLGSATQEIIATLRLARSKTLSSQGPSQYGVYFDTSAIPSQYVLFKGSSFSQRTVSDDKIYILPNSLEISEISLSNSAREVAFARVSGEALQAGFITLRIKSNPAITKTISVYSSGRISLGLEGSGPSVEFAGGTTDADLASFPGNSAWGDPGQSFTTESSAVSISVAHLYLKKATTDPSDIFLEIRSASTTGTVLGISQTIDSASLPISFAWISFNFYPPVSLAPMTQYFLRLRSIPDSTIARSGAKGTIYWGYVHAASSPPALAGGDAWRYIGSGSNPSYEGQRLGPADQYDFSFKVIGALFSGPLQTDSRHVHVNYSRAIDTSREKFVLTFEGSQVTEIVIADNLKDGQIFWEGEINVSGFLQKLKIQTHRLNNPDTLFSIHRDRRYNNKSLRVKLSNDSGNFVNYSADGLTTTKTSIYASDPTWQ